jgi:probable H4MPT-linked C1 transfer pathway protein
MPGGGLIGLDIGGAHLKAAWFGDDGALLDLAQFPCPLWQGMDRLDAALAEVRHRRGEPRRVAATMTGELADLFDDRADGVRRIMEATAKALPAADLRVFAGPLGLVAAAAAADHVDAVASANWFATARVAAMAAMAS